ncbi:hypothetical protein IMZ48_31745 [Candidatus Bathyarchaeota archaeon]|nr:hypothetical protein [Candidatus Bathyarchaeota archaeon]
MEGGFYLDISSRQWVTQMPGDETHRCGADVPPLQCRSFGTCPRQLLRIRGGGSAKVI